MGKVVGLVFEPKKETPKKETPEKETPEKKAAPDDTAEDMAVCAMADALYYYEAAANGLLVQSASVGSVSSSSAGGALPDMSPRAQSAELYRCAQLYLDIYRGAPRPRFYGSGVRRFSQSENRDEVEEVR